MKRFALIVLSVCVFVGLPSKSFCDDNITSQHVPDDDFPFFDDAELLGGSLEGMRDLDLQVRAFPFNPWQSNRTPRTRDILYLVPLRAVNDGNKRLRAHFVYHTATRLTHPLDGIISNEFLKEVLELASILLDVPIDAERAAKILAEFTVQERIAGILIEQQYPLYKSLFWNLDIPFLMSERNFWVHPNSQTVVRELLAGLANADTGISVANISSEEIERSLSRVPVKGGLGDTRISLGVRPYVSEHVTTAIGASLVMPTSRILHQPTQFCQPPPTDLLGVPDIFEQFEILKFVCFRPFPGKGYWGVGLFLDGKWAFLRGLFDLWGKLNFDYYAPRHDQRFILADGRPTIFVVRAHPGAIVHLVTGLDAHIGHWTLGTGYDLFFQQSEHIRNVKLPDLSLSSASLNVCDATRPEMHQQKVMAHVDFDTRVGTSKVLFGIEADFVVAHSNMGKGRSYGVNLGVVW